MKNRGDSRGSKFFIKFKEGDIDRKGYIRPRRNLPFYGIAVEVYKTGHHIKAIRLYLSFTSSCCAAGNLFNNAVFDINRRAFNNTGRDNRATAFDHHIHIISPPS